MDFCLFKRFCGRQNMKKFLILGLTLLFVFAESPCWADEWQELNPAVKPAPRSGHSIVVINGIAYLFGGIGTGRPAPMNDLWKYDPTNNSWTELKPSLPPPARHSHSAAVSSGKLCVFFGLDSNNNVLKDIWSYSPTYNSWQKELSTGTVPAPRYSHSSIGIADGRILTFGGLASGGNPTDPFMWSYTPCGGVWERKFDSPAGSLSCQSVSLFGDKMYLFGGYGTAGYTNNIMIYDPAKDSWNVLTLQGNIPVARVFSASAYSGNSLWIFGGESATREDLQDTWEFNTATCTWTQKTDMPVALKSAQAVAFQSQARATDVLMFGGTNAGVPVDKTYGYLPESNPTTERMVLNQIGALSRGHFSLLFLRFANTQEKVKIELEWAQADAKLKLCVLRLPHFWAHDYFWEHFLGGMEPQHLEGMLGGFDKVEAGEDKTLQVNERNKIEKTVEKVRGLILWVRHGCHSAPAKDI